MTKSDVNKHVTTEISFWQNPLLMKRETNTDWYKVSVSHGMTLFMKWWSNESDNGIEANEIIRRDEKSTKQLIFLRAIQRSLSIW